MGILPMVRKCCPAIPPWRRRSEKKPDKRQMQRCCTMPAHDLAAGPVGVAWEIVGRSPSTPSPLPIRGGADL